MREPNCECPRCKGPVFKKIEKGEKCLGENPKKNYERYDCHACKLFWERGDVLQKDDEVMHE